jgi:hypothetical protein
MKGIGHQHWLQTWRHQLRFVSRRTVDKQQNRRAHARATVATGLFPPSFFLVQTAHDTFLCIETATGRLRHLSHLDSPDCAPLLYSQVGPTVTSGVLAPWEAERGMRFLDDSPVLEPTHPGTSEARFADQDETEFKFYPVLMHRCLKSLAAFQDPFRMLFLSAEPPDADNPLGQVGFRKDTASDWEHFRLVPLQWRPAGHLCKIVAQASSLLSGSLSLEECASAIAAADSALEQETWLAICFRALAFPDFIRLLAALRELLNVDISDRGSLCKGHDGLAAMLIDSMRLQDATVDLTFNGRIAAHADAANLQPDFWTTYALPALTRWRTNRQWSGSPDNQAVVGTDLDFLQSWEREMPFKPSGRLANFIGRYCTEPTKDVCVIASARNEGPYLLEWIAHHQAIGIQSFFIYSNNNDDGSDALLERLSEAGVIYYLKNVVKPGTSPQYKAYKHALSVLPDVLDYRWALMIDLDEFLVLDANRFKTIGEFLAPFNDNHVDAICFNWALFGSWGQAKRTPELVRHRFIHRAPQMHWVIKCAARPNRFLTSHAHFPFSYRSVPIEVRHSSGARHVNFFVPGMESAYFRPPTEGGAWVNHYHCKSAEEYLWTRARGTGDWPIGTNMITDAAMEGFLAQHNRVAYGLRDERALHCAPNFDECYQRLISIPGIQDIISNIDRIFQDRVTRLKNELSRSAPPDLSPEVVTAFVAALNGSENPWE